MGEVADFLTGKGVRSEIFAINTVATNEAVVLYQEGPTRWVVFYAERGLRREEKVYDSEEAVCQDVIARALAMENFARTHRSR